MIQTLRRAAAALSSTYRGAALAFAVSWWLIGVGDDDGISAAKRSGDA